MKAHIALNGKVQLFLAPDNTMEELALEELSKSPVELVFLNKQVQILDKQFSKGAIIQPARRPEVAPGLPEKANSIETNETEVEKPE